jgi:hypothetical protein
VNAPLSCCYRDDDLTLIGPILTITHLPHPRPPVQNVLKLSFLLGLAPCRGFVGFRFRQTEATLEAFKIVLQQIRDGEQRVQVMRSSPSTCWTFPGSESNPVSVLLKARSALRTRGAPPSSSAFLDGKGQLGWLTPSWCPT